MNSIILKSSEHIWAICTPALKGSFISFLKVSNVFESFKSVQSTSTPIKMNWKSGFSVICMTFLITFCTYLVTRRFADSATPTQHSADSHPLLVWESDSSTSAHAVCPTLCVCLLKIIIIMHHIVYFNQYNLETLRECCPSHGQQFIQLSCI